VSTALARAEHDDWSGPVAAEAPRHADRHLAECGRVLAAATHLETDAAVLDVK
jgi:hypothetical protein